MSPVKLIAVFAALLFVGVGFLLYDLRSATKRGAASRASSAVSPEVEDRPAGTVEGAAVFRPSEPAHAFVNRGGNAVSNAPGSGSANRSGERGERALPEVAVTPPLPVAARPPAVRPSAFADPRFLSQPELQAGVDQRRAIDAAEHGATPIERTNAIQWLMSSGDASAFPVMQSLERGDPDPEVRNTAAVAVNLLRSRFGAVLIGR